MTRVDLPRISRLAVIFVLLLLASAASHHGFFSKYALRDGEIPFAAAKVLDGTAHRPFAYRYLLPATANAIHDLMPESVQEGARQRLENRAGTPWRLNTPESQDSRYAVRYYLLYYLSFFFAFSAALALYCFTAHISGDPPSALIATCLLMLMMPVLQSMGGYYYDFPELFFMAATALMAVQRRRIALLVLAILGAANKESFIFFTLCLAPLFVRRSTWRVDVALLAGIMALELGVYAMIRNAFADNPGGTVQSWIGEHVSAAFNWKNYVAIEVTYGLFMPQAMTIVWLGFYALIAAVGWPRMGQDMRYFTLVALGLNIPLYLLFCYPGEARNLSMLFVPLAALAVYVVGSQRTQAAEAPSQA